jgi:hypothetical protein
LDIIAYYEGSDDVKDWLKKIFPTLPIDFRRLPTRNDTAAFIDLPSYIADILLLDKPDVILAGSIDGIHERPMFSIEFASCTPQYQHALQRFSRMVASVTNGCPSIIVIPKRKRSNDGASVYTRSKAIEYGAVRLMDLYACPAFVLDWPDNDGELIFEKDMQLPALNTPSGKQIVRLLEASLEAFNNVDYRGALATKPIIRELTDDLRVQAYANGVPTPENPGGGTGGSQAKLEVVDTTELIDSVAARGPSFKALMSQLPTHFLRRPQSLVFHPTRITAHAGDPYVGMVGYYDIAFCRSGISTRERNFNLVALADDVSSDEITDVMKKYNEVSCPFTSPISKNNVKQYGAHLRTGCRFTKNKPTRVYSELLDLLVFTDSVIF